MAVTRCGRSGLNAARVAEVERGRVKEPVPTLPLWETDRAAIIWVNLRRLRNVTRIRVLIVSESLIAGERSC